MEQPAFLCHHYPFGNSFKNRLVVVSVWRLTS